MVHQWNLGISSPISILSYAPGFIPCFELFLINCNHECSVGQRIKLDDQVVLGFITRITLHYSRYACPVSNHPKLLICVRFNNYCGDNDKKCVPRIFFQRKAVIFISQNGHQSVFGWRHCRRISCAYHRVLSNRGQGTWLGERINVFVGLSLDPRNLLW